MNTSANDNTGATDDLINEARVWLRLLTSTDVKSYDTDGFRRWLNISASHKAAFRAVKQRWDKLEAASSAYLNTHPDAALEHKRILQPQRTRRRAFIGAAVAATAAVAVVTVYPPAGLWPAPAEWGADDRTGTGEQRKLTFADQVTVTLNTQTSIRREEDSRSNSSIALLAGEAAVDLPPGGASFSVVAGAGRSFAQSGSFEVRYTEGKVYVSCLEGAVRVEHPGGRRELSVRQQTAYDAGAIGGIARIEPVDISAWRRGELVFNEIRLIDVLSEINRYRPGGVVLMNKTARNRPVSGRFLIASLDAALAQLQQMFGLRSHRLPGGLLVLN